MRSIRFKLTASIVTLVCVIVMFVVFYFPHKQQEQYMQAFEHELQVLCETLALAIAIGLENQDYGSMKKAFDFAKRHPALESIHVFDAERFLLASYPEDDVNKKYQPVGFLRSDTVVGYSAPIGEVGQIYGYVVLSKSLNILQSRISDDRIRIFQMGFGILILCLGVVYMISKMVSDPIVDLTMATEQISRGDYQVQVPSLRADEFGVLAERFNTMTTSLEKYTKELKAEISERERTAMALLMAKESAEAANQAKSAFLANMSHELRTPLNSVIGTSDILAEKYLGELNEQQEEYVQMIKKSGLHLLALINDILDLSKVEAGFSDLELSSVLLKGFLADCFDMVRELANQKNIALKSQVQENVSEVVMDVRKVKQVMLNLLSNAVKFTPEGGEVGVNIMKEEDSIIFCVWDTGIGIAEDQHAVVFEAFMQADNSLTREYEGTGLGLALVKKFVELHGGRVWLESELGKGSRFLFALPVDLLKQTEQDHH